MQIGGFQRLWTERTGGRVLFNGYKGLVWSDGTVLKVGSGEGCTTA